MAAVELLAATRDPAYDGGIRPVLGAFRKGGAIPRTTRRRFCLPRLPDGLGDPQLKRRAVERITAYADHAIEFSRKRL